MAFSMTFEGADDDAFTVNVVTMELVVAGCDTGLENEGDEQTAWDHRKGKASVVRRVLRLYWMPATVEAGGDMDHGHFEAFHTLCRKPHRRITDTDLPRVTRIFEADGSLGDPFSIWEGRSIPTVVAGLLPFVFEHGGTSLPKYDAAGRITVTSELFAPMVEAVA